MRGSGTRRITSDGGQPVQIDDACGDLMTDFPNGPVSVTGDTLQPPGADGPSFSEIVRSSHHLFRHPRVRERINLQRDGAKAKVYQVRQVRRVLIAYDFVEINRE